MIEPASREMLRMRGLTKRFGGFHALNDLYFEVREGDIHSVIGPNGAGKTTLFNLLSGTLEPDAGEIMFEDQTLGRVKPSGRTMLGIARTFQNIRLFPAMTVLENLIVAQHNKLMKASGYTVFGLLGLGVYRHAEADAVELAKYWLDKCALTDRADWDAGNLPYGDQRRLEVARAMCTEPILLCLDEPAAGLNPRESAELNELLRFIRDQHKIGVLLIEHDMKVVMEISDHIVVLDYGQKISDGTPEFVRGDPAVISAYLGEEDDSDDIDGDPDRPGSRPG